MDELEITSSSISRGSAQSSSMIHTNNIALAKRNSLMMTKISKLENKISDLISENVQLRQKHLNDLHNRKIWFDNKLNEIENCVQKKLGEINDYFKDLRNFEGLDDINKYNSNNKNNNNKDNNSNSNDNSLFISEKKRKSVRRQSMFLNRNELEENIQLENNNNNSTESSVIVVRKALVPIETDIAPHEYFSNNDDTNVLTNNQEELKSIQKIIHSTSDEDDEDEDEEKKNSKSVDFDSLLSRSINNNTKHHEESSPDLNDFSQSTKVSNDILTDLTDDDDDDDEIIDGDDEDIVLEKDLTAKTSKESINNEYNQSLEEGNGSLIVPKRRTRGKSITYTLPNLKSKMRRPNNDKISKRRRSISKRKSLNHKREPLGLLNNNNNFNNNNNNVKKSMGESVNF